MAGATDSAAVRKRAGELGIEFFFAEFVDLYARPSAKLVPASNLDGLLEEGAGFAGFAAGEIGQGPHDPDLSAMPDPASFTPVPWQPDLAWFACDVHVEGKEWPYDPRTILRHQLARAKEKGFEFKIGAELEYFLLRRGDDGSVAIADALDTLEKPCYDLRGLTRNYDFLTTVSRYCNELGWGNYANDHEDANGQFEQNFEFADALTTCDRAVFFRYMIHALAQQRGLLATFMPKPFTDLTGNGCHFHMSLWDGDRNLFLDDDDPRGFGLSELGYHFIGGLKAHAKAYIAVTASTVNSYKRLKESALTQSGATWSPVYVTYGYNNRTQMLRVPGPGGSRIARSTAPATPISRRPWCSRRGWTASSGASTRATRTPATCTSSARRRRASRCSRRTCSTRRASSSTTTSCGRRWAAPSTRTTSTTTSA